MNVIITGGSGYIGTHIIESLLENPKVDHIINIDLNPSTIKHSKIENKIGDIRNSKLCEELEIEGDYSYCIHLAALCKEPGFEWDQYFETNHQGTINVIELCDSLGIEEIIFTSTMMVYKAGEYQRNESSITSPDTAYGISKLLGEKELFAWKAKKRSKRKIKVVRPAVVFGENENANFTRLYKSLKKGFFPYVGKSTTIKSSIYVKELVSFIDFLTSKNVDSDIFNLAFPEDQSIKKIIEIFKEVFRIRSFNPIIPYKLLLLIARGFEMLNAMGLTNSIHHRRIQKLYFSTNIFPQNALSAGYVFKYNLKSSLEDWEQSNDPNIVRKYATIATIFVL
ncbi:NAD(P)-dependent oxidoreductase [Ekhidna sp.]|uniref:NAD-dependent epimerase/dehydratase family protein n=1 Tax=Ekhidna sp. TaxID=2608089 RepID=UPI003298E455